MRLANNDIGSLCRCWLVLDRLIANCLSWWLEEHSALSPWQAGFRKGCSTTDQCLQLPQFFYDGFQSNQRCRAIATFFDISRAYGTDDENFNDGRSPSLHSVAFLLVHIPYSLSVSDRFHWPLLNFHGGYAPVLRPFYNLHRRSHGRILEGYLCECLC